MSKEKYLQVSNSLGEKLDKYMEGEFEVSPGPVVIGTALSEKLVEHILSPNLQDDLAEEMLNNSQLNDFQKELMLDLRECIKMYFEFDESEQDLTGEIIRTMYFLEIDYLIEELEIEPEDRIPYRTQRAVNLSGRQHATNPVQPHATLHTSLLGKRNLGFRDSDEE